MQPQGHNVMILQDLKLFFSNEIIEFYCHQDSVGTLPEPIPAYKNIPEWWRKLVPTDPKEKDMFGGPGFTAKKCMYITIRLHVWL